MQIELLEKLLKELIDSCDKYIEKTTNENFKDYVTGRKDGFKFILNTITMAKNYK